MLISTTKIKRLLTVSALVFMGTSWINLQQQADPVPSKTDRLTLPPGFVAEHLHSPSDSKQGSWVSMTFDAKGRLITSDQYGFLYRTELPPVGSTPSPPRIEKLTIPNEFTSTDPAPPKPEKRNRTDEATADTTKVRVGMGYAQGLLWAFNSLYVMVNNQNKKNFEKTSGLYRLQDTDGDDQFDKITLLKSLDGDGEHGPHSIVLTPDKKSLVVVAGNFTKLPQMDAHRLPPVWQEDNLLTHINDPRGHDDHPRAPYGWIAQTDSLGKTWELISAGFRNPFDIAFNEAGDLFTYDSDMEWDLGLPWYRPTRICHVTSGAEFGWRPGSSKWLPAFADNLPPVVNMGQGSPTNLINARNAQFPERYRRALLAFDWSFGIIHAIHLKPKGASYEAEREEFISGLPLPLTDGVIGPDGALYFLTGGRKLESDLFRVYYRGTEAVASVAPQPTPSPTEEHRLRTRLEQYHGQPDPGAVAAAWPHLAHPDRFVRYAARMAIEHQPVGEWQAQALSETDPQRATQALIALARQGNQKDKSKVLEALLKLNYPSLSESGQGDVLRAFELVFSRMGKLKKSEKSEVVAYLDPQYPANSALLNRQLSKLLIYLEAPGVIEKTLALLRQPDEPGSQNLGVELGANSSALILRNMQYGYDIAKTLEKVPPLQQTHYAVMLSRLKTGWTPTLRAEYFEWFAKAFSFQGGNSYIGFADKARRAALKHVPKNQRDHFSKLSGEELLNAKGLGLASNYTPEGPGRNWELDSALAALEREPAGRDFDRGKKIFSAILCNRCHVVQGEGGDIGPDLTQLGTRFSSKDILEAIITPNKVVSDQYAATVFNLKNGETVLGRLISEDETSYSISINPFTPSELQRVRKADVASKKYSAASMMMPGLINSLNRNELKDLMAYLKSGGNQSHEIYKAE